MPVRIQTAFLKAEMCTWYSFKPMLIQGSLFWKHDDFALAKRR